MNVSVLLPIHQIEAFCQRWRVSELSVFGSALRDDFRPDSDIDLLIAFDSSADWGLLDHAKMQQELAQLLQRDVDLVSKRGIEQSSNWIRRQDILSTAQVIYAKP